MATLIKGEDLILSIWNGTDAYEPIGCLTSNSLELTRGIIESQTKCDPGVTIKNPGNMTYSIPFEAEYPIVEAGRQTFYELFDRINTNTPTTLTWRMETGQRAPEDIFYYGTGILTDLSLSADAGENISTFSGTIEGSGLIVTTDPEA